MKANHLHVSLQSASWIRYILDFHHGTTSLYHFRIQWYWTMFLSWNRRGDSVQFGDGSQHQINSSTKRIIIIIIIIIIIVTDKGDKLCNIFSDLIISTHLQEDFWEIFAVFHELMVDYYYYYHITAMTCQSHSKNIELHTLILLFSFLFFYTYIPELIRLPLMLPERSTINIISVQNCMSSLSKSG